jgi:hypothetical protein
MRKLSFDIEDRMKSIGWYQILGGIFGLCWVIYLLIQTGTLTGAGLLLTVFISLLFSFGIYCGNFLRKADIRGLKLSIWNQALQVLQIGFGAFVFEFYSGIRLSFGFEWLETFLPDGRLSLSGFSLQYNPENNSLLSFWINIIPIIIIYLIDRIEKDIEERKQIAEITINLIDKEKANDKEGTTLNK